MLYCCLPPDGDRASVSITINSPVMAETATSCSSPGDVWLFFSVPYRKSFEKHQHVNIDVVFCLCGHASIRKLSILTRKWEHSLNRKYRSPKVAPSSFRLCCSPPPPTTPRLLLEVLRVSNGSGSVVCGGPGGIRVVACENSPALLFMFAFTPCLLSLRMEIDGGRSFAQEKALLAVRVVTAGGESLLNRTDFLTDQTCGRWWVLMGDNCGEQKEGKKPPTPSPTLQTRRSPHIFAL